MAMKSKKNATFIKGVAGCIFLGAVFFYFARSFQGWKSTATRAEVESYYASYAAKGLKPQNRVVVGKWEFEDSSGLSVFNLEVLMKRFTEQPHPMGSPEQKELARDMRFLLQAFGWQSRIQNFRVRGPNLSSARFGGNQVMASAETDLEGENVLGYLPGAENCVVLIGGHYDTKMMKDFRFVGANDGGSSTVLQLELARLIPKVWNHHPLKSGRAGDDTGEYASNKRDNRGEEKRRGLWRSCGIVLAFFDGEEATLPGWYDGEKALGIQDNLYGSRAFTKSLGPPPAQFLKKNIELVIIIDMVGHKNQNLFLTEGSDKAVAEKLEELRGSVKLKRAPFKIDDDHVPFLEQGIRTVHMIDWTNLEEWHKETDTPAILSYDKMAQLGDVLMKFLKSERNPSFAKKGL